MISIGPTPAIHAGTESMQIRYCRVICIFFMMFTHLKAYEGSIAHTGEAAIVGMVIMDYLGRASVAALSLISGYLLVQGFMRRPLSLSAFLARKTTTIALPMLIWNALYIGLVFLALLTASHGHRILPAFQVGDPLAILNAFTGAFGTPANHSLFFIRDLLVCQVILFCILKGTRHPIPFLAGTLCLALTVPLDPVVYREPVLAFSAAGALLAAGRVSLIDLSRSTYLHAFCILSISSIAVFGEGEFIRAMGGGAFEIYKRSAMTALVFIFTAWAAGSVADGLVRRLSGVAFLCYLLHLPLTSTLWMVWQKVFPDERHISYLGYFLLAPVVAALVAVMLGAILNRHEKIGLFLGVRGTA